MARRGYQGDLELRLMIGDPDGAGSSREEVAVIGEDGECSRPEDRHAGP